MIVSDDEENKIGQNEMLNAVQPDLITGGEVSKQGLCTSLERLDLKPGNLFHGKPRVLGESHVDSSFYVLSSPIH